MGQVTLQDGSTAVVTKDNWQQLAAKNQAIADQQGLAIDPQANLTAFQEAGNDTFFPGDGPATVTPPGGFSIGDDIRSFFDGLGFGGASTASNLGDSAASNAIQNSASTVGDAAGGAADTVAKWLKEHIPDLPNGNQITLWLVLGVVGILGVAYISHKVL